MNELRAVVAANPADTKAELELVSLLAAVKGPDAARAELLARIKAGPGAFTYEIALAKFDLAQGKADDSIKLLQQLIGRAGSTEKRSPRKTRWRISISPRTTLPPPSRW